MNKLSSLAVAVIAAACLSSTAFADPGTPPPPPPGAPMLPPPGGPMPPPGHPVSPEMFQKMKARMLDNQQQRIQILQQGATCMQAATAIDQIKDCRDKEHQALTQLQDQMKQQRKQDRK
ncbi:MAG TPA: hypothetical protein VIE69_03610 [Methylophilaceae bacterium]|jgi:hypothetical protein